MAKFANAKAIELISIINIYAQQAHQIGLVSFNYTGEPTEEYDNLLKKIREACDKIENAVQELKSTTLN